MIFYKGKLICSGTLIDTRHVLTSVFCLERHITPDTYQVRFSMHYTNKTIYNEQAIGVQTVWQHEKFGTNDGLNDIALLRLAQAVTISEKINVICLPGPEANEKNEKVWYRK
jgi:secreted trypsin-like serine protease